MIIYHLSQSIKITQHDIQSFKDFENSLAKPLTTPLYLTIINNPKCIKMSTCAELAIHSQKKKGSK